MRVQTLPQNYRHNKCGAKEAIPENIARNLVLDPCWYSRYTICPGCGEVPIDECTFLETGQSLSDYRDSLLRAKGTGYHVVRRTVWLLPALFGASLGRYGGWQHMFIGFAVGAAIGLLWGRFLRMALCKMRVM